MRTETKNFLIAVILLADVYAAVMIGDMFERGRRAGIEEVSNSQRLSTPEAKEKTWHNISVAICDVGLEFSHNVCQVKPKRSDEKVFASPFLCRLVVNERYHRVAYWVENNKCSDEAEAVGQVWVLGDNDKEKAR